MYNAIILKQFGLRTHVWKWPYSGFGEAQTHESVWYMWNLGWAAASQMACSFLPRQVDLRSLRRLSTPQGNSPRFYFLYDSSVFPKYFLDIIAWPQWESRNLEHTHLSYPTFMMEALTVLPLLLDFYPPAILTSSFSSQVDQGSNNTITYTMIMGTFEFTNGC
jgi:hypothetical protein